MAHHFSLRRRISSMYLGGVFALMGTASCSVSIDRIVESHHLERAVQAGTDYDHLLLTQDGTSSEQRLHIYIEGDGTPWVHGRKPARDPTPRNPIALKLMLLDAAPSVYVGRPCYFGVATGDTCDSNDWTFGRYSVDVIDSMAAVIEAVRLSSDYRDIVIFGYSGGGALARHLATRVTGVVAIVTVAANLDTDAWTEMHGYLPLSQSRNPAELEPLPATIGHLQLIGENDQVVPELVTQRYRSTDQSVDVWSFSGFDHRCCWQNEWQSILAQVNLALATTTTVEFDDRKF